MTFNDVLEYFYLLGQVIIFVWPLSLAFAVFYVVVLIYRACFNARHAAGEKK